MRTILPFLIWLGVALVGVELASVGLGYWLQSQELHLEYQNGVWR